MLRKYFEEFMADVPGAIATAYSQIMDEEAHHL